MDLRGPVPHPRRYDWAQEEMSNSLLPQASQEVST